jgi:type 1 fimbriae regulatory protein FimB
MALMAYRHGLRVSELADLRLDEIDLTGATLRVRRVKRGLDTSHPIEGDELRAIRAWLRERSVHGQAAAPWLFLSERGGKLRREAVNYIFGRISRAAGFTFQVYPHMLRHSCGYALADRNTATRTIQDYLGHTRIENTVRYTAANPERFRRIWRK